MRGDPKGHQATPSVQVVHNKFVSDRKGRVLSSDESSQQVRSHFNTDSRQHSSQVGTNNTLEEMPAPGMRKRLTNFSHNITTI